MINHNYAVDDFITPYEAEHLVRSIQEIDIREFSSKQ